MADEIKIIKDNSVELNPDEAALLDEFEVKQAPPRQRPRRPVEPGMDAFMNDDKKMEGLSDGFSDDYPEFPDDVPRGPKPSEGYISIEDEKADLLNKLSRLEKKGFKTSGNLTIYSDIEQLRTEYKRIMYQIESDQAVKVARRVLIACVTGIEFMNKRFDPFDLHLDGWSENVMENVEDYDNVFEELHTKYKDKIAVAPEIKLIMMVGGSAMMFHLTKSIFKSTGLDTGKVFKENPDILNNLMNQVKQAQSAPPPGPRDMKGPGIDLGSLMSGFMPPPPPINSRPVMREEPPPAAQEDDMSDIISVTSDTKDLTIKTGKRTTKKKKEVTL